MKLNIKPYVDKKYKNKNQFALDMRVTYPTACKLYSGETTQIKLDTLETLCKILDCTPSDILIF